MELYYTYGTESGYCEIIAASDGMAISLDEIPSPELESIESIRDIIHDGLRNGRWQDFWNDLEGFGVFFPASEIPIRYPNAIKYSAK